MLDHDARLTRDKTLKLNPARPPIQKEVGILDVFGNDGAREPKIAFHDPADRVEDFFLPVPRDPHHTIDPREKQSKHFRVIARPGGGQSEKLAPRTLDAQEAGDLGGLLLEIPAVENKQVRLALFHQGIKVVDGRIGEQTSKVTVLGKNLRKNICHDRIARDDLNLKVHVWGLTSPILLRR